MRTFGAKEVRNFLGKKIVGQLRGEIVSDMTDRGKTRWPGTRVKHRAGRNWIKMHDKAGSVLRVETVINQPEAFKVRKHVQHKGQRVTEWVLLNVQRMRRTGIIVLAMACGSLTLLHPSWRAFAVVCHAIWGGHPIQNGSTKPWSS